MRTWTTAAILVLAISQMASASPIAASDFINPMVIDFDDYSGFVGGPTYADPWLSEGVRIWGSVSGGDIHTYPYSNNAVIVTFVEPVQRVGADLLYAYGTTSRLEVYDIAGHPLEHVDGSATTFLGLDVGTQSIYEARFIDLPDVWSTFPVIDNLHYEVPEPATVFLLGLGGLGVLVRRGRRARPVPLNLQRNKAA